MNTKLSDGKSRKRFIWNCEQVETNKTLTDDITYNQLRVEIASLVWEYLSATSKTNEVSQTNKERLCG